MSSEFPQQIKVLCIESDIKLATLIQRRLERAQWQAQVAHTADEGLRIYAASRPQIVIMDYALPDQNGIELLGRLRELGGEAPEVIMVTGAGDEKIAVEAMQAGARDYLIKDDSALFLDLLPSVLSRALVHRQMEEEKRITHQALLESEQRFRTLVEYAPEAIVVLDVQAGRFVDANENAARLFGYPREALLKLGPLDVSPAMQPGGRSSAELAVSFIHNAEVGGAPTFEWVCCNSAGKEIYCEIRLVRLPAAGRTLVRGSMMDITQRKKMEEALFAEKERAQVTLRSIGDAVISTDVNGYVDFLNPVAEKLTGWPANEANGRLLMEVFQVINGDTKEPADNPVKRCLNEGSITHLANHTILVSRTGVEYAIEDSAAPIYGKCGEVLGVVLVFKDVTATRQLSQQVSYQATHDTLTGLINRTEFERRLRRVLDTAHGEFTQNALCYLDLDQFKLVNDTGGHVAGDELLRQLGQLLQKYIRKRDTLARLGGDEFGLLMEHCSLKEAQGVAENLVKIIGEFNFPWEEHSFKIGASIGLVAVNQESATLYSLLRDADTACYMAKEQGGCRVHLHQDDDEELARHHGEMRWAVRLPRALEEDRFQLYYQNMVPVKASNHDQIDHYELLLRMEDETGKLVQPGVFLPAAERYHLSDKVDRWVIRRAFKWLQEHPSHLKNLNICSINLSGLSLSNETFLPFVVKELELSGIPPQKICFEVTETVAIANLSYATSFIKALRHLGCRFALDDFGSGLSSFAYLKNLPVDFLKIDGVFVKDILDDPMDLAMVKSINEIGHVMGKQTIAEFVENEAILERLRDIGVDYAQGYGNSIPRPLNKMLKPEK